jgi:hypothetical protein
MDKRRQDGINAGEAIRSDRAGGPIACVIPEGSENQECHEYRVHVNVLFMLVAQYTSKIGKYC